MALSPPPLTTQFMVGNQLSKAWQVWFSQVSAGANGNDNITLEGDVVGAENADGQIETKVVALEGGKPIAKVAITNNYNDLDDLPNIVEEIEKLQVDITQLLSTALCPGAAGADTAMLVCFDEFSYNPVAYQDVNGSPLNCSYDILVQGKAFGDAVGNINYMLQQDLASCPTVETLVMWAQWWTVASGAATNMGVVQPGINSIVAANLGSNTWSVNGVTHAGALQLPGRVGGSPDDASFLAAAQLLVARGYKVGVAPIVIGINVDVGTPNSSQTSWRGYFQWPSTAVFTTWLANYTTMVQHYFDLLNNAGIPIDVFYIASEMQDLSFLSSNAIWALWVAGLQSLASYIKNKQPNTKVTYACNWSEYGNGSNFRTDSIWTCPNVDYVGVDWYPPMTTVVTDDPTIMQAGLRAGEQMDFLIDDSDNTQRVLTSTAHNGKVGLAQTPKLPPQSVKNLPGFYYNAHYLSTQGVTYAEATPLPGYDRTYNPNGLSLLSSITSFGLNSALPVASGNYGMYPPPLLTDTWLNLDGTHVPSLTLPVFSAVQYFYQLNFTYQLASTTPAAYSRLFRIPGVAECLCDVSSGNEVKLGLFGSSELFFNLAPIDTNIHSVTCKVDISGQQCFISVDGAAPVTYTLSGALTIPTGATMYVGGYDGSNNQLHYSLFSMQVFESNGIAGSAVPTHGGTFYFDEAYCGVRTAWIPQLKPVMITETGVAAIGGSSVEPNVFPQVDYGTPVMRVPGWVDAFTQNIFQQWISLGWSPSQMYGPYGSNFAYDQQQQAAGLKVIVSYLKSMAFIPRVCVYAFDVRPIATMLAQYKGTLYYVDGPLYLMSQILNGKLAGGKDGSINTSFLE